MRVDRKEYEAAYRRVTEAMGERGWIPANRVAAVTLAALGLKEVPKPPPKRWEIQGGFAFVELPDERTVESHQDGVIVCCTNRRSLTADEAIAMADALVLHADYLRGR